ncbi:maternal protein pumilio-like [Ctenocephalides felis]|nr:maternal protein pumilio-like [Ctenocephalides felis]
MAPSAKKLWDNKAAGDCKPPLPPLHLPAPHEQLWRDSTWSTQEVSQAMMSSRRAFPAQIGSSGADNASILSPRDSTSGLGVKMVEYVLGGSPTAKESPAGNNDVKQEAQGQNQTQNSSANNKDNKGGSPFDVNGKKEDCCLQQNGQVNGVDDDKGFK